MIILSNDCRIPMIAIIWTLGSFHWRDESIENLLNVKKNLQVRYDFYATSQNYSFSIQ